MYADIAAHRAMCSVFLRLTVNDVMFPPVVEYRNKESVSDLSALLFNQNTTTYQGRTEMDNNYYAKFGIYILCI